MEQNTDELKLEPTYPKHWYDITAVAWLGLAATAGLFSVYLYPMQGNWVAGVLAVSAGILYALIAKLTVNLRDAKHQ